MNLTIPAELERSLDSLRLTIVAIQEELRKTAATMALDDSMLRHHQHDFARDITSRPRTYTPATHTHAAYALYDHTHGYSSTVHTHPYSSSTHTHTYHDYQPSAQSWVDTSRTTGGPV